MTLMREVIMTKVYFVRHAQPCHGWQDDRTRPLTNEGLADARRVTAFFRERQVDAFFCSPYRRSLDTIRGAAALLNREIFCDERLRERVCGAGGNTREMIRRRWTDKDFREPNGESIRQVQARNVAALMDILDTHAGQCVVIGTHGTALSTILHYFDPCFDCDAFFRLLDWMPYVLELDFDGRRLTAVRECFHVEKTYRGIH